MTRRKAEGACLSATSISQSLTKGVFSFCEALTYDLEPMATEAGQRKAEGVLVRN